ncbi:hypothetical protein [Chamaesiphon sp. VAR_48_metabat_135_sub]|uniref:hypothetical protein n=1 Tax=Chamaesiphon sp. VAR_48_metabat_135_sub TaxID=2964699 RepID=UPI00286A1C18|nr:hypothetical protein [Chamaesiphon sp. VAR_48_metabat_135_sub]
MNSRAAFLTFATTMLVSGAAVSAEGPVVWADTTCSYFIVQLPEGNPAETFGLFRSNTNSIPKVGDIVEITRSQKDPRELQTPDCLGSVPFLFLIVGEPLNKNAAKPSAKPRIASRFFEKSGI